MLKPLPSWSRRNRWRPRSNRMAARRAKPPALLIAESDRPGLSAPPRRWRGRDHRTVAENTRREDDIAKRHGLALKRVPLRLYRQIEKSTTTMQGAIEGALLAGSHDGCSFGGISRVGIAADLTNGGLRYACSPFGACDTLSQLCKIEQRPMVRHGQYSY